MKKMVKGSGLLESMKERIIKQIYDNNSVLDECALTNNIRLYYLSLIAIPLRIIILLTFNGSSEMPDMKIWSRGIIASHLVLLIFMIVFLFITHNLKKRKGPNTIMFVLQYIAVLVIMATGIIIVTFDQLVTTNITPFLLTCIITGLVFLIRPFISFVIYIISYGAYSYLIGLTIANSQILLSNRINGMTAVGVGFLLSIILWNYNYTTIKQKKYIEVQQKQLELMAYYDSLTDLPNRRLFDKLIKEELSLMKEHGYESVIIILDIDNFKNINDTYGHPVGDNILNQFAGFLKNNVRESDTVSRFGGEEFVILMPKTSLEEGYSLAERVRKSIMAKRFNVDSLSVQITASFGLSLLQNRDSQSLKDCYLHADKALYFAKQGGKNKVEIAKNQAL